MKVSNDGDSFRFTVVYKNTHTSILWRLFQSAFLNGDLQDDVYMAQPCGFEVPWKENQVCKLGKALYGLKQDPRAQYAKMDAYLQKVGFLHNELDDTLYVQIQENKLVILVMYVDDFLITGTNNDHIFQVKQEL